MVEIKHIRKESKNKETHEMIDLENTKQEYFVDRILIQKDGEGAFLLEQSDFEKLYQIKKQEFDEKYRK